MDLDIQQSQLRDERCFVKAWRPPSPSSPAATIKIKLSVKKWKLKKSQAVPLLNGVNDLVLVLERLLHGSSDLPHLSVKVDVALLLSR